MAWLCALELAHADIGGASSLVLPWETGVMSQIFGRDVMGEQPIVAQVPLPELEVVAAVMRMEPKRPTMTEKRVIPLDISKVSGLAHRGPKRPKAAEPQQSKEDRLRLKYICGFTTLILGCGDSSDVGRQLRSDTSVKGPEEIVSDVLFSRRTATLGARLQSLMAYSEWLRVSKGKPAFPLVEQDAYDYVVELYLEGAPATRATRFRETVAFVKYVLGADGAMAVLASVRVGGSALRSFVRKRMLRQRDPLRVVWVSWLEQLVVDEGADEGDRLTAGSVLWLLFCRSRMADSQHLIGELR
jgi:hypothetical protein